MLEEKTKTKEKDSGMIPGSFDPVFKEIFTSGDCRNFVCTLISLITGLDLDYLKKNLKVVNPNLKKSRAKEKTKPTDVILSIKGNLINIEMNNKYYDGLFQKNDMYQHTILSRSMKSGDSYKKIKNMIQINIDNFSKFKKEISVFKLMEIDTGEIENEYYVKYHISLSKILDKYYNGDKLNYLEKLLCVIGVKDEGVLNKISKGDKILMEASKKIEDLNLSDLYSDLYDVEKDRQMAEKAMEDYIREEATKQGIEQGIKQGIKQGIEQGIEQGFEQGIEQGIEQGASSRNIEIAKNLIKNNVDIDIIARSTGLSKEEIESFE